MRPAEAVLYLPDQHPSIAHSLSVSEMVPELLYID